MFCIVERGRAEPRARRARDQPASPGLLPAVPRHGAAHADPDDGGVAAPGLHPHLGQPAPHQAQEDRAQASARGGGEPRPPQCQCAPRQPGHDGAPDLRDCSPGAPAVPHPATNTAAATTTTDPGSATAAAATDPAAVSPAAAPAVPGDGSPRPPPDPPVPRTPGAQPAAPVTLAGASTATLASTSTQSAPASTSAYTQPAESSQQEGREEERET